MSYIALARAWRPRTFAQLLGQDHINKALINSLNQQRLHHAYLFTGTRGVGKTSVARLLAKALNCEQGISSTPCLTCDACIAIEQGRFIDLIEIDGASRTRIEDTRDLLDNVHYAPTNARFKIYLIDEVHMLSQHSFNALLKTLEEPPSHVKFLLATTDPQKLPITVLSRCLQFTLKPVQVAVICQHLQHILDSESLSYDISALDLLAKAAQGSIRDALSLLDQAIASCDGHLHINDVKNSLGFTQEDYALQLLTALANFSSQTILSISRKIGEEGGNYHYVLEELLTHLHQISIDQSLSQPNRFSTYFTPEDTQLLYQIALKGAQDLSFAPTMMIGFEMTLLRMMVFRPAPLQPVPQALSDTIQKPTTLIDQPIPVDVPVNQNNTIQAPIAHNQSWSEIIAQLNLTGLTLNAAENAELLEKKQGVVTLGITKGHQSVFTPSILSRLEDALSRYYKEKIKLVLNCNTSISSTPALQKEQIQKKQHQEMTDVLENDAFFKQVEQDFSAQIIKKSISLLKNNL